MPGPVLSQSSTLDSRGKWRTNLHYSRHSLGVVYLPTVGLSALSIPCLDPIVTERAFLRSYQHVLRLKKREKGQIAPDPCLPRPVVSPQQRFSERLLDHMECVTHLINEAKLLANQQLGGDSLVGVLVEALQERSSTEELRRFIMVDNHEAVKIGDLKKTPESLSVVQPNFSADVPEAEVREDRAAKRRRRYTANFHQYHQCWETIDGDRRWWTRIGTSLPSQQQGRQGSGMGELVLQVRGDEQGCQGSPIKWK